jgi:hypothetical protein
LRSEVIGLGVLVLIIGIAAYAYAQQASLLGYTYTVGYPYRDLGTALIVLGFVALIGGAATKSEAEQWKERGHERAAAAIARPPTVDSPYRYCTNCGQSLRQTDAFCPRCGMGVT